MRHEQPTPEGDARPASERRPEHDAPPLRLARGPIEDRRRHERTILVRACKVKTTDAARFLPASTTDVSAGGALIQVGRDRPFKEGERIQVGVDWGRTPILSAEALVPARVVRVVPMDRHQQAIGIAFDRPLDESLSKAA